MGLRGPKPSDDISARDRLIWRLWLQERALGYRDVSGMYDAVTAQSGVMRHTVIGVILHGKPDGCYDDLAKRSR